MLNKVRKLEFSVFDAEDKCFFLLFVKNLAVIERWVELLHLLNIWVTFLKNIYFYKYSYYAVFLLLLE